MKKQYTLLASALLLSVAGFSQERTQLIEAEAQISISQEMPIKQSPKQNKLFGDTMAYFDFNAGLPPGWSVFDNANNGFNWTWANTAPRGARNTNISRINSTTANNGFIMLESDNYNTPIPTGGAINMDSYVESGPIPILNAPSVLLRFQQHFRICCQGNSRLDLEVRSNLVTKWDTFNVKEGYSNNTQSLNPLFTEINISSVAANVDTIYIRFHQSNSAHYFWAVDDIAVVEGPSHDLILDDFGVNFLSQNSIKRQFYEEIPLAMFDTMWVQSTVINNGAFVDSGIVHYEITQDLDCFGTPGYGTVAYVHEALSAIPGMGGVDVSFNNPFLPPAKGMYTISSSVQSASVDQVSSNNRLSNSFIVGDSVYAKDDGTAEGRIGPDSYVGFDQDGSGLYLYYEMPKAAVLTSVSYFIRDSTSIGTSMSARVYGFDTTGVCNLRGNFDRTLLHTCLSSTPVAFNPAPLQITASDLNKWTTVPMLPTLLNQYPAYLVGYDASGYTYDGNGRTVKGAVVGNDLNATAQGAYNGQGFYDMNTILTKPNKVEAGIAGGNPMMRMNFGQLNDTCILVGIDEKAVMKTEFGISPNPNNGQFNLMISTEMSKDYNLTISNMIGQNIYTEQISLNNEVLNRNMNFSHLKKGIYFVTLQNATERQTQKIVIR